VNAIALKSEKVKAALEQLHDIPIEMLHTREDASTILNGTERYEFISLPFFWSEVLSSSDQIRKCSSD
jgi:hypothetical protein